MKPGEAWAIFHDIDSDNYTVEEKGLAIKIILDHEPLCGIFYEDAPGEAHWIKHETFDDGETYECDHCGVEWQFNDGGPEENEAFFCPKCGFKMIPKGEADGQTD